MKLALTDFWDGFQNNNNFFLDLFQSIDSTVELSTPQDCDVLIYSCFGKQHLNYSPTNKIKIFYTGENLRPNFNECTYSFTFDFDSYEGRNIRIPLWLMQIDWFNKKDYENPKYVIPPDQIDDNRFKQKPKDKFCCIVINTIKPERVEAYNLFNTYKKVEGFGRPFKNWFYGEEEKLECISNYKFSICFENTIYPGYFTEKLIHAKVAGNIPIYSGDKSAEIDFNEKAYLNLVNYSNLTQMFDHIKMIDQSKYESERLNNEKLFKYDPKDLLEHIKDSIKNKLKL